MRSLMISPDLSLPLDAVTHTFGILGMRGSGKSNLAVVMAEQMFKAGLHFVVLDPKGDWWGMRSSKDGRSSGLPIPIFGGRKGDVPLEPEVGAYIAELVVQQTLTCILDLSEFTEGEKTRFLAGYMKEDGFAARFYRRKSAEQPPTHLFLEEADDMLPQKAMREKAKLLHDCSRLLLWGRQRGIGGTYATQRSARIHKDVLTQSETLFVFRTTAPQDQKAVKDWVHYHGQSEELLASLSGLHDGEGWVWCPEWLGIMKRTQFNQRETFDSGATPKTSTKEARKPATLADVNLQSIQQKMAESIERAKAEDPKELRRRIAELEKQVRAADTNKVAAPAPVDSAALERAARQARAEVVSQIRGLPQKLQQAVKAVEAIREGCTDIVVHLSGINVAVEKTLAEPASPVAPDRARILAPPAERPVRVRQNPVPVTDESYDGDLPPGERKILTVLVQYPGGATREQLSVMTGYRRSSRDAYLQRLRTRGYARTEGNKVTATNQGRSAMGSDVEPLPVGVKLQEHWLVRLPEGEGRILKELLTAYPDSVHREVLGESAGYKRSSRDAYIQRLKSRQLVRVVSGGQVIAVEDFF